MNAPYTWDVFSTLDGFGSYDSTGDWGGYWGRQGPEFLHRRAAQFAQPQRLVLGATTFRVFQKFLGGITSESEADDPVNTRMKFLPTTVISGSLDDQPDWPDATVARGDGAEIVRRLKTESDLPLRSHGSPTLNRSLLNAGLVDCIQLTIFPVISGRSGAVPIFAEAADFDLELLEACTLDGRIQELTYRPTLH